MRKLPKTTLLISLCLLVIAASFGAGFAVSQRSRLHQLPSEFELVDEAWGILLDDFVDREALDPAELSRGAVGGMVRALDDPYTAYLDPEDYESAQENLKGKFEGIGAWVRMENKELVVVSTIEGSPAEEAGIRAGDRIIEVEGEPTLGMSLSQAVLKVRGSRGTKVKLSIVHQGELDPVDVEVTRAEVKLDSVHCEILDGIAHIRVAQFSEDTGEEFACTLRSLEARGARAIVLDLRDNHGGLLSTVIDAASQFLPEGEVVLRQVDNEGKQIVYKAKAGGLALEIPVVLLVNRNSASGSEVLAGALQYYGRAPLIGTTTFGKGSVCFLRPLQDGSGVYITTARWLTPGGELIEGEGLDPDIEVEMTEGDLEEGKDTQLERALDYLEVLLNG